MVGFLAVNDSRFLDARLVLPKYSSSGGVAHRAHKGNPLESVQCFCSCSHSPVGLGFPGYYRWVYGVSVLQSSSCGCRQNSRCVLVEKLRSVCVFVVLKGQLLQLVLVTENFHCDAQDDKKLFSQMFCGASARAFFFFKKMQMDESYLQCS